jgi:hypothetical protein
MIELPCLMLKREGAIDYEALGLPEPELEEAVMNVCLKDVDWFHTYDDEAGNTKVSYRGDEFICTLSYDELKKRLCSQ